jgi:hypothetical protein
VVPCSPTLSQIEQIHQQHAKDLKSPSRRDVVGGFGISLHFTDAKCWFPSDCAHQAQLILPLENHVWILFYV